MLSRAAKHALAIAVAACLLWVGGSLRAANAGELVANSPSAASDMHANMPVDASTTQTVIRAEDGHQPSAALSIRKGHSVSDDDTSVRPVASDAIASADSRAPSCLLRPTLTLLAQKVRLQI